MDPKRLMSLKWIVLTLLANTVVLTLAVVIIKGTGQLFQWPTDELTVVVVSVSLGCLGLAWVATRLLDRAAGTSLSALTDPASVDQKLFERWQLRTIVGCAILEGGIVLNLVWCLVRPNLLSCLAIILMLPIMSLFFPGSQRMERWMDRRREELANKKIFR